MLSSKESKSPHQRRYDEYEDDREGSCQLLVGPIQHSGNLGTWNTNLTVELDKKGCQQRNFVPKNPGAVAVPLPNVNDKDDLRNQQQRYQAKHHIIGVLESIHEWFIRQRLWIGGPLHQGRAVLVAVPVVCVDLRHDLV